MAANQLTKTNRFHSMRQKEKTKAETVRVAQTVAENIH